MACQAVGREVLRGIVEYLILRNPLSSVDPQSGLLNLVWDTVLFRIEPDSDPTPCSRPD